MARLVGCRRNSIINMSAIAKIPITVVTGFLGSGKTTLVNRILQGSHGKKIAVIENEYGEVGIDDALVMETKEEIFEMNNGCICCTVRGDLIRILNKLLKRKNRLDAIMIETTGLANPAPVIQTFFVDDEIKDACLLDAVLTVVDAKHITMHLDDEKPDDVVNEAVQQIAFADKVLLNKLDLVSQEEKQKVVARIRAINRTVDIIDCQHAEVDLDVILGIKAFNLDKLMEKDPEFLDEGHHHEDHHHDHNHGHDHDHDHHHDHNCSEKGCTDPSHKHDHHHDHTHDHDHHDHSADCADKDCKHADHKHGHLDHKHDDRVSSVGIQAEGSCDQKKLQAWLQTLLQEKGVDLFRSKGILSMEGSDAKHVFQGVHMLLQFSSSEDGHGRPWQEGEKRVNKLVFIGKNLNRAELEASFRACLATNGDAPGADILEPAPKKLKE